MSDLPAIIGGLAVLLTAIFGGLAQLEVKRSKRDSDSAVELAERQAWSPRVLRAVTMLRDTIARATGVTEPDGIDELIAFPPPKPKHLRAVEDADAE